MSAVAPAPVLLDSSVALGAFFSDEQDDYSLAVWRSLDQAIVHVPALWHLEMGNILSRALRAGRIRRQELAACWSRLEVIGLRTLPPVGDAAHWTQLATDLELTSYDACYIDAARVHRMPLATKDQRLADAARRQGIPIYLA